MEVMRIDDLGKLCRKKRGDTENRLVVAGGEDCILYLEG